MNIFRRAELGHELDESVVPRIAAGNSPHGLQYLHTALRDCEIYYVLILFALPSIAAEKPITGSQDSRRHANAMASVAPAAVTSGNAPRRLIAVQKAILDWPAPSLSAIARLMSN